MRWIGMIVLAAAVLGGCTSVPPETTADKFCNFKISSLDVDEPPEGLRESLAIGPEFADPMLILSGGGQHGAFGAGFLEEWEKRGGALPRFAIVTGISTGSILSTWAFIGKASIPSQAYRIQSESEILKPYARRRGGKLTFSSYIGLLRHNALADLAPLRERIHRYLTLDTLEEVVRQSRHRSLLIGAVDADSGNLVVFDMVDMASKAIEARDDNHPEDAEHFRDCYIEAILASSSVPMAARPIFIDNRMYIDGGARFGMFVDTMARIAGLKPAEGAGSSPGEGPRVYILVSGTQQVGPSCGKSDRKRCDEDGYDSYLDREGAHRGWDFPGLALRSTDILINQGYRFSVADIVSRYKAQYPDPPRQHLHFARIQRQEMLDHEYPEGSGRTCRTAYDDDERNLSPLEFYPHYMACLIDYGRVHADALGWQGQSPLNDPTD